MQELDFQNGLLELTKRFTNLLDQTSNPVLLIDGRAGSGKSTLASALRDEIFRLGDGAPHIVHMDDLYQGWEGLREGSNYLMQNILGKNASSIAYQVWNWEEGRRGSETNPQDFWREFSPGTGLIVEGCGSLSRLSKDHAALAVWLECDLETRKARWQKRDGHRFDNYWPIWEMQEDKFYELENSKALADLVIHS